jgi:hypothetical protein
MIRAIGALWSVAFATVSLPGTAASGWVLGEALSPARAGSLVGPFSLSMVLLLLAVAIEGMRLALSLLGERIWRGSAFQGVAFAGPLWLACTAYCTLMPLLALAFVPVLPLDGHMMTVTAPAWAAVQIAAGLLPGITWSRPETSIAREKAHPAPLSEVCGSPTLLVPQSAASADDFLGFLSRLSELPAGSTLPRRGRIGSNQEIIISQAGLAALVGRSKPTVCRWLQELECGQRLTKRAGGKDTCILLRRHALKLSGEAHRLNGEARI